MHRRYLFALSLLGLVILTAGCPGLVPGSRQYQPLPKFEAGYFSTARRDVFPNDARKHPDQYTNTLVVWTGVITKMETVTNDAATHFVVFTVEHHYFDWVEDFGVQREHFFLSPRSEGVFQVGWIDQSPDDQRFLKQFSVGDMLVAYGYPQMHHDRLGLNPTMNLRAFKPRWYRMDVFDYGRPGEPVRQIHVPF